MSLNRLRLSMAGTLAVIIGVSTLGIAFIMAYLGNLNLTTLVVVVGAFNLLQWLLAPYLVNFSYKAKRMDPESNPGLFSNLEDMSRRSGIKTPKLMLSRLPIPNAFAYGSPLTGSHVAVTQGLLDALNEEQVNAVVGHELGHIKNRDMHIMMAASFLPSLFYLVARSMMFSGDRDRKGLRLAGVASLLVYFALTLANLSLSRTREYFADRHSATIIPGGAKKLGEALAKISQATWRTQRIAPQPVNAGSFKALFISDPDRAAQDLKEIHEMRFGAPDSQLVDQIAMRRVTGVESFMEIKKKQPGAKVYMMTGFSVNELVEQAVDNGALGVLSKPVDLERVFTVLEELAA